MEVMYATIAQLVEHRICNAAVAGSNPVCGSCTEYSSIGRAFALGAKGCTFKSCYSDREGWQSPV